jgi:DNA end-binding protein Ku
MAPRPYWKGYLKLSLVSCAVALYPAASRSERVSLHWLNRQTGNRLRQLMVDADTSEPVEREDRVRGYQLAKHDYLQIEDSDLDAIEIESSHTIDIESFVPRGEIDPVYLDNAYYLAPNDKVAEEAFAVIREAMAQEGVAGLGRAVISRRERIMALEPRDKGILATALHYNYEVRGDQAYFGDLPDIAIPDEMLDLAKHIIRRKIAHFDIEKFEDRYENALIETIRAKEAGRPAEIAKPARAANVINLMDALRKSIAAETGGVKASEPPAAKPAKAPARTGTEESKPVRHAAQLRSEPKRVQPSATESKRSSPGTKAKAARKAQDQR